MAQSAREAAVVRVRNVPPRALRSREERSDRVLQRAPCKHGHDLLTHRRFW